MSDQLPAFVLAELFSNSLVDVVEELKIERLQKIASKPKKEYLGNYERKIIVLVNDDENMYLSDAGLEFLTDILNACKLNLAHIALINFNKGAVDFAYLKKEMHPGHILMFGVNALQIQLPFNMPDYQVQHYDNCKISSAPSLSELGQKSEKAKAEKVKLWKSLQKIFSLEK